MTHTEIQNLIRDLLRGGNPQTKGYLLSLRAFFERKGALTEDQISRLILIRDQIKKEKDVK